MIIMQQNETGTPVGREGTWELMGLGYQTWLRT